MRTSTISRETKETTISLTIDLDGSGKTQLDTGVGFFDHMLDAFSRFALVDLAVSCKGDLYVDEHHTIEDVGICLGKAIREALGDRAGIRRVGSAYIPMDEALAFAAIDISGRPYLAYAADFATLRCGDMGVQMAEEFFRAVVMNAGLTVHLNVVAGRNDHHKLEAMFKAFGLALRDAMAADPRVTGVLSTKGALD